MHAEPLVVTTREPAGALSAALRPMHVENIHFGSIAVVTVDGALTHWVGDPAFHTFTRSTLKPLQALDFVREGGPARFGWGSEEVALMCASHSGEPMHTERVARMLASADCEAGDLQCGCHVPGFYAALGQKVPSGRRWTTLEHNCSGKHAGFLAACRLHDQPVARYLDPDEPVQQRVASAVAAMTGLPRHAMAVGTDGCSAPNFAMPLSRLALAYARLAQGTSSPVEPEACGTLFDAMTRHPELVSGTRRSDVALMAHAPGDWVTKIGADGVQAIGIRSLGLGIAVKIADGSRPALYCAVLEVLSQLGLLPSAADGEVPPSLQAFVGAAMQNAQGLATGSMRPGFTLRRV